MKKNILIFLGLFSLSLISCTKDYTCKCIYPAKSSNQKADTVFYKIEKETKSEAVRICEAYIFSEEQCEILKN
ncbi:MAG: hypothetical protein SNJ71_02275 [Bacteroidales bacterium]